MARESKIAEEPQGRKEPKHSSKLTMICLFMVMQKSVMK